MVVLKLNILCLDVFHIPIGLPNETAISETLTLK